MIYKKPSTGSHRSASQEVISSIAAVPVLGHLGRHIPKWAHPTLFISDVGCAICGHGKGYSSPHLMCMVCQTYVKGCVPFLWWRAVGNC